MSNSVNTNAQLYSALGALNTARLAADRAEKKLQTGYETADAADDAAIFAVSQQIRADVQSWDEVMRAQAPAKAAVIAASAGLDTISGLVNKLKATVIAYAGAQGATEQTIYANDANQILAQINSVAATATVNGTNLLSQADIGSSTNSNTSSVSLGAPTSSSGGFGLSTTTYPLPAGQAGTVVLRYDMYGAPDGAALDYNGLTVATTGGLVSGQGVLTFNYGGGAPASIDVVMNGGSVGTAWSYTLEFVTPTLAGAPTAEPTGSYKVIADTQGNQTSIRSVDSTTTGLGLNPWSITPTATALTAVDYALSLVAGNLGYYAERARTLDSVKQIALTTMDAMVGGLGALADADIGKAQAQALAARARIDLATQGVGIANQFQKAILGFLDGGRGG